MADDGPQTEWGAERAANRHPANNPNDKASFQLRTDQWVLKIHKYC